jgi:3-deoxy-D-manno-octulosonic-acid transferase
MKIAPYPTARMRIFLLAYALLWTLALPLILLYLRRRARKDPDYAAHLGERFGRYPVALPGAVWVHAVSLGELRSAVPLIEALLARGEHVVTTHFTPAGRREAMRVFAGDIAAGRLLPVWIPLEFDWAYRRFFKNFSPRYGLVMEIEIWPRMIAACRRHGVPLLMCNAQYPSKSYERDTTRMQIRAQMMTGFAGALVKSDLQRRRFESVGVTNIAVTGELRFDQPVPAPLVAAGQRLRAWLGALDRPVAALASVVEGEDEGMLNALQASLAAHDAAGLPRPLFLYIPRAPERFDAVADMIAARGLAMARRSSLLAPDLAPLGPPPQIDVLLGDSLGEMYAWLAMSDRVVVGGGFTLKGSHNISEPLALGLPVMVGPDIHTIEYPAVEAISAGVCRQLGSFDELAEALSPGAADPKPEAIEAFFAAHSGAVGKTLEAIPRLLAAATRR